MARKRQEKAVKSTHNKKGSKATKSTNDPDADGFVSFNNNLGVLGLNIREVPGDGNCLFRALGDQLEGHGRNHVKHRLNTVEYMLQNRADFEPFVEDDKSFDSHICHLSKPGTYAGNDAIVAFARLHGVAVFIHQLDAPLWQINGKGLESDGQVELHIAYHNGDHYNSIRKLGDNSEAPANIRLGAREVQNQTNSDDSRACGEFLEDFPYLPSEVGNGAETSEDTAKPRDNDVEIHLLKSLAVLGSLDGARSLPNIEGNSSQQIQPNYNRVNNKDRKELKRVERKKANDERKRRSTFSAAANEDGDRVARTVIKDLGCLTI